uniref:Uncharacterized protein n=1 Tax=Octopus bimaculoides TaxID=37653 RepID=A0A0L8HC78_OCTBM
MIAFYLPEASRGVRVRVLRFLQLVDSVCRKILSWQLLLLLCLRLKILSSFAVIDTKNSHKPTRESLSGRSAF